MFSQRKGLEPLKTVIQINSIDLELKSRLWNSLERYYWSDAKKTYANTMSAGRYSVLFSRLWDEYFKRPLDTLPFLLENTISGIREFFFMEASWYDCYDFLEKVIEYYPYWKTNEDFMDWCNPVLESEVSAYRFVGGKITQITAEEEISEIEEALATPLKTVRTHLETALVCSLTRNLLITEILSENQ